MQEKILSAIASMVLSVLRDRAISSCYGACAEIYLGECGAYPPYKAIFQDKVVAELEWKIGSWCGKDALLLPLYSGEGDMYGMLGRLMIACNELIDKDECAKIIGTCNKRIAETGCVVTQKDDEHLRHLRNAVVHGRVEIDNDPENPFQSIMIFSDVHNGSTNTRFEFTAFTLNDVIDILIDTCLECLKASGWIFDSPLKYEIPNIKTE